MRERIGSANAAVLPVPVWARPTTCWPASSGGIASAWIGDGRLVADVLEDLLDPGVQPQLVETGVVVLLSLTAQG